MTTTVTVPEDENGLRNALESLEAAVVSGPLTERPSQIKAGVDLGTAYTVLVALDGNDRPLAAARVRGRRSRRGGH